jgi:hypothetical protein
MREFFILFTYFSFISLAGTCFLITYQIIKHGIGNTKTETNNHSK